MRPLSSHIGIAFGIGGTDLYRSPVGQLIGGSNFAAFAAVKLNGRPETSDIGIFGATVDGSEGWWLTVDTGFVLTAHLYNGAAVETMTYQLRQGAGNTFLFAVDVANDTDAELYVNGQRVATLTLAGNFSPDAAARFTQTVPGVGGLGLPTHPYYGLAYHGSSLSPQAHVNVFNAFIRTATLYQSVNITNGSKTELDNVWMMRDARQPGTGDLRSDGLWGATSGNIDLEFTGTLSTPSIVVDFPLTPWGS